MICPGFVRRQRMPPVLPCGVGAYRPNRYRAGAFAPGRPHVHPGRHFPVFRRAFMAKITYIDAGGVARTVDGEIGSTVMETAIKNGVTGIEAECGGACACSTCHVYVGEGGAQ